MRSKLAENAIKLNEKFTQLRAVLGPEIERANERERMRAEGIVFPCCKCGGEVKVVVKRFGTGFWCQNSKCGLHLFYQDIEKERAILEWSYYKNIGQVEGDKLLVQVGQIMNGGAS